MDVKRPTGAGTDSARASKHSDGDSSLDSDASDDTGVAPWASQRSTLPSKSQSQASVGSEQEKGDSGSKEDGSGGGGSGGVGSAAGAGTSQPAKRQKVEQMDEVPLMVPAAVCKDNKASLLVHLRDETLNFSGDTGAVGRISVHGKKSKGSRLTFDLKGQQFDGQIIPSATVLIVGVGRTEAKVEGIFSEVCRLDYKGNVLDSMGGQVLKGQMDESYKFQDEDVNTRSGGVGAGEEGVDDMGIKESGVGGKTGGKATKSGRKRGPLGGKSASSSSKKGPGKSASAKKGTKARPSK